MRPSTLRDADDNDDDACCRFSSIVGFHCHRLPFFFHLVEFLCDTHVRTPMYVLGSSLAVVLELFFFSFRGAIWRAQDILAPQPVRAALRDTNTCPLTLFLLAAQRCTFSCVFIIIATVSGVVRVCSLCFVLCLVPRIRSPSSSRLASYFGVIVFFRGKHIQDN